MSSLLAAPPSPLVEEGGLLRLQFSQLLAVKNGRVRQPLRPLELLERIDNRDVYHGRRT